MVDVGTGDGRAAWALAKERPDTLVVGLDPVATQLVEVSRRAARRPERGGLPNLLFGLASAQQPPEELTGRADEVRVTLPWGDLLEGLALAHADVLDGLARLARPGTTLRVVVNGAAWEANAPKRMHRLPRLTPEYVRAELTGPYARHGVVIGDARGLTAEEIDALHSTWAKRLRHGREHPTLTLIEAHVRPPASGEGGGTGDHTAVTGPR